MWGAPEGPFRHLTPDPFYSHEKSGGGDHRAALSSRLCSVNVVQPPHTPGTLTSSAT